MNPFSMSNRSPAASGVRLVLVCIALIWLVFVVNLLTGGYLNRLLAVYPRQWHGLFGLLGSPFAHASWTHIVSNTIPFAVLASLVLLAAGTRGLLLVLLVGATGSGLGAWLLSSADMVVGASGVVFAMLGFLLGRACVQPGLRTWLTAGASLFLYSGMLLALLQWLPGVSWTGHFFGFAAGAAAAVHLRALLR